MSPNAILLQGLIECLSMRLSGKVGVLPKYFVDVFSVCHEVGVGPAILHKLWQPGTGRGLQKEDVRPLVLTPIS